MKSFRDEERDAEYLLDKMIEYENLVNQLDLSRGGFGVY